MPDNFHVSCDGRSGCGRRDFIKTGVFGFLGMSFMQMLNTHLLAEGADASKCDSVILIWLPGGPSQIDTFDPKPGRPCNLFNAIPTSADGIQVTEHFPKLAQQMKHVSLIRSMYSKEFDHERATHLMHTSYPMSGAIQNPGLGANVTFEKGKRKEGIPAYVCTFAGGRGNVAAATRKAAGAGFLDGKCAPFLVCNVQDPSGKLKLSKDVSDARFKHRVDLMSKFNREFNAASGIEAPDCSGAYDEAVQLLEHNAADAFDIAKEPEKFKQDYGNTEIGKGLLMARRLVEKGVRFVEVVYGEWDHHSFFPIKAGITDNCKDLDPAMAALIADLNASGLLKRTLIICTGEMGRTSKFEGSGDKVGRDHNGKAWSTLIGGGGVKPGIVVGSTDADGSEVKDRPVSPGDLHATVYDLLGVSYKKENTDAHGFPHRLVNKKSKKGLPDEPSDGTPNEPIKELIA